MAKLAILLSDYQLVSKRARTLGYKMSTNNPIICQFFVVFGKKKNIITRSPFYLLVSAQLYIGFIAGKYCPEPTNFGYWILLPRMNWYSS